MAAKLINKEKEFVMQTYKRQNLIVEKGKGSYVFDNKGKKYIDLVSGIACCTLGHGNNDFADNVKKQILKITNPTNLYYSEQQVILAEKLAKLSGLKKCFFSNSGAEAIEAAIKLARKHTKKTEIICMKNGFHGRTFGSLAATGKESIKKSFKPMLQGFKHVEYGNVQQVKKAISKKTAAILVEPIQGEAGIIIPPKNYLKELRKICNKKNILLILDEVQTGCGRTGKFFAYQHEKIHPDIVTLAKGLANGLPIGVTIASEKVAKSFVVGDHGSTFGGNPVSCSAANFTIGYIISKKLIDNAKKQGNYFIKKLNEIDKNIVKEVRGKGLMIAIEIKKDANKSVKNCLSKGLIINSTSKYVIRLLPPLIINKQIIDKSIQILKKELK